MRRAERSGRAAMPRQIRISKRPQIMRRRGSSAHEILIRGKPLCGYCPDPAVTAPLLPLRETEDWPDE